MPTQRLTELPDPVMRLVEEVSGPVVDVQTVKAGRNSAIAARVQTSDHTLFVKGLPLNHPWVWTQKREADISPYVRGIAPELHWHLEEDGWSLLGFEYVEGGHADFTPGSPDLPGVMATMARLAAVPAPEVELKTMPHRLRTYVDDPADLSWFAGNSLLHTEWNPHNVVMTGSGALFVDWGWASTGAAWIDPALWLLWKEVLASVGGKVGAQQGDKAICIARHDQASRIDASLIRSERSGQGCDFRCSSQARAARCMGFAQSSVLSAAMESQS
jgi:hypothetical protein